MWKFIFEYDRLKAYIHVNYHVRQIEDLPTWRIPILNIDRTLYLLKVLITRLDNEE